MGAAEVKFSLSIMRFISESSENKVLYLPDHRTYLFLDKILGVSSSGQTKMYFQ
jgi:hypothetical protein